VHEEVEDWGNLIGDVASATAILVRFLYHAESLTGKSYRIRNQERIAVRHHVASLPATNSLSVASSPLRQNRIQAT
jgi:hypothetical protein